MAERRRARCGLRCVCWTAEASQVPSWNSPRCCVSLPSPWVSTFPRFKGRGVAIPAGRGALRPDPGHSPRDSRDSRGGDRLVPRGNRGFGGNLQIGGTGATGPTFGEKTAGMWGVGGDRGAGTAETLGVLPAGGVGLCFESEFDGIEERIDRKANRRGNEAAFGVGFVQYDAGRGGGMRWCVAIYVWSELGEGEAVWTAADAV